MVIPDYHTAFDGQLIDSNLPEDFRRAHASEITDWVNAKTAREINDSSLALHAALCRYYFSDLIDLGQLDAIYANMISLDSLIEHVRVRLGNKFYRDHIAHTIRVALLFQHLLQLYYLDPPILFPWSFLGPLFHDIAYPLQEHPSLVNTISNILDKNFSSIGKDTYKPVFKNTSNIAHYFSSMYSAIRHGRLFQRRDEQLIMAELVSFLLNLNHSLLSSFELWSMVTGPIHDEPNILNPLLAIALHDSETSVASSRYISSSSNPHLFILILADELQEWNRIFSADSGYIVTSSELTISRSPASLTITCDYHLGSGSIFNPLLQMPSKKKSLSRLLSALPVNLIFTGIKYDLVAYNRAALGTTASIPSVGFTGTSQDHIALSLVQLPSGTCVQFCVADISYAEPLTNRLCLGASGTRTERVYLLTDILAGRDDYLNGSISLYADSVYLNMILCISQSSSVTWPAHLSSFSFQLAPDGLTSSLGNIDFSDFIAIPRPDTGNLDKYCETIRTESGDFLFIKELYTNIGIPLINLFVLFTR